jgi:hypothetical protein
MCHHNSNIQNYTELPKLNSSPMLLPKHSIWLMPKIPSRWENSVICSFKCELKNSQSYLLCAIKGENKTGLAMVLLFNHWPVTVKAWVKSHSSPSGICNRSDMGTGFSPGTSVCNYQCHSTTVLYSYFIHLPMYYEQLRALLNKTLSRPSAKMKCTVNILQSEPIHCSLCWGPNENQKSYQSP